MAELKALTWMLLDNLEGCRYGSQTDIARLKIKERNEFGASVSSRPKVRTKEGLRIGFIVEEVVQIRFVKREGFVKFSLVRKQKTERLREEWGGRKWSFQESA